MQKSKLSDLPGKEGGLVAAKEEHSSTSMVVVFQSCLREACYCMENIEDTSTAS